MTVLTPGFDPSIIPPPEVPHRQRTDGRTWLRRNLFKSPLDGVITVLSSAVVLYVLYRVARFVFVTGRWDIVRVNLRLFMYGRYPADELWRLVVVGVMMMFLLGIAVGNAIQRNRLENGPTPPVPLRRRLGQLFARLWPLILGLLLLLSMAETFLPWVVVAVVIAASVLGREIAERLPDRYTVWLLVLLSLEAGLLVWMPNGALKVALVVGAAGAVVAGALLLQEPPAPVVFVLAGGVLALIVGKSDVATWIKVVALIAVVAGAVACVLRIRRLPASVNLWLVVTAVVGAASAVRLLTRVVGWDQWGGLMLNLFLAIAGITLCFPLGVLLALGRRAGRPVNSPVGGVITAVVVALPFLVIAINRGLDFSDWWTWILLVLAVALGAIGFITGRRTSLPLLRLVSTGYIELIRGMPLFVLLLIGFASLVFFLPVSMSAPGLVVRAIVVLTLFTAAYIAEIVRGGLQSLPKGQTEAAQALGLSPLKTTGLIVMPQALRNVIPSIVGQFISLFKDTTLAGAAMGFAEMLNVRETAQAQEAFRGARLIPETVTFVMFVFWIGCITMSRESQRLERKLGVGTR